MQRLVPILIAAFFAAQPRARAGTSFATAGQVAPSLPVTGFPPVSEEWGGALGDSLTTLRSLFPQDSILPDLAEIDFRVVHRQRILAPLLFYLEDAERGLGIGLDRFRALGDEEKRTNLILAAGDAAAALDSRANELIAKAFLSPSEGGLDADQTRELWLLKKRYGLFLSPDSRELVAQAYARAASFDRAREFMRREAPKLGASRESEADIVVAFPNSSTQKLYEGMENSRADWSNREIIQLLTSFGFDYTPGTKHDKFQHPVHQDLYLTVPRRNGSVLPTYVTQALRLIRRLQALLPPPRPVSLGNLAVRP